MLDQTELTLFVRSIQTFLVMFAMGIILYFLGRWLIMSGGG